MNKFSKVLLGGLALIALVSLLGVEAQQRQGRQRSPGRNKPKGKADQCHGKEIDKCYEQLQAFGKADRPSEIIKTREGVDKLCKDSISSIKQSSQIKTT